ncbi:MAG TPA: TonB family protein [Chthoniobacterales bacterium]|nr:TonB family protein [Chthoniobacterales bacterium]
MTTTLLYQPTKNWGFGVALGLAIMIHLAAIGFASVRQIEVKPGGLPGEPPEITVEPEQPITPQPELSDPLPTPPTLEQSDMVETATRPPIYRVTSKVMPVTRRSQNTRPGAINFSSAKVFALSAPRPEYPYEARRQRVTGDGVAVLTVDPATGAVVDVSMARSTGNQFLDNAALTGFRRWRFRPGTVSSVTCPVTFALTGAVY